MHGTERVKCWNSGTAVTLVRFLFGISRNIVCEDIDFMYLRAPVGTIFTKGQ